VRKIVPMATKESFIAELQEIDRRISFNTEQRFGIVATATDLSATVASPEMTTLEGEKNALYSRRKAVLEGLAVISKIPVLIAPASGPEEPSPSENSVSKMLSTT
jgi:hypothetical protein